MKPLLSIIIPSIGRAFLSRTLDSIDMQPGVELTEVLVVADSHSGAPEHIKDALADRDPTRYRYFEHDGGLHAWGHPQRNFGMLEARGAWLMWMADDDVYTPWALSAIVRAQTSLWHPCPMVFRAKMHFGITVWQFSKLVQGNVDAECLVVPNIPERLGRFGLRYEGDLDFALETQEKWGGPESLAWCTDVIAVSRPTVQEWADLVVASCGASYPNPPEEPIRCREP